MLALLLVQMPKRTSINWSAPCYTTFKGGDLVTNAIVAPDIGARHGEEAQGRKSVVELNRHDILSRGHVAAVQLGTPVTVATSESSPVDAEHDGSQPLGRALPGKIGSLQIEIYTVFTRAVVSRLCSVGTIRYGIEGLAGLVEDCRVFPPLEGIGVRYADETK